MMSRSDGSFDPVNSTFYLPNRSTSPKTFLRKGMVKTQSTKTLLKTQKWLGPCIENRILQYQKSITSESSCHWPHSLPTPHYFNTTYLRDSLLDPSLTRTWTSARYSVAIALRAIVFFSSLTCYDHHRQSTRHDTTSRWESDFRKRTDDNSILFIHDTCETKTSLWCGVVDDILESNSVFCSRKRKKTLSNSTSSSRSYSSFEKVIKFNHVTKKNTRQAL